MGVKSLWTLLTPVGRPILLETIEGKALAIDSSIWIYQFQATMRDKEGRALVNAHVLGFLRRITKLLFYGIKPVFVFDGGAPALKRATLNDRKKKKAGAALSHIKIAERLLAAQMRREALNHARSKNPSKTAGKGKAKAPDNIVLDEHTVYLEDIDGSTPKSRAKPKTPTPPSSSKKKNQYHDHDPYRLPEVDMEEVVIKATRTSVPDPRLATEEELRAFIEDMRPGDFDVTSPEFRELPTEVQYEIIGDLRLKSRQTSHARLQNMLRMAPTAMDFSKQQIINLKERNSLTQQLLTTTDSIGNAHLSIPVRIASERNREYVLTKNDGVEGGWVLAIQDQTGTAPDKPILIETEREKKVDSKSSDEDEDMEEVDVTTTVDSDLRQYQREMALSAIAGRYTPKNLAPLTTKPITRKTKSKPLFDLDEDEVDEDMRRVMEYIDEDEDEELAYAIQESLDQAKNAEQQSITSMTRTPINSPSKLPGESPSLSGARPRSPQVDIFTPSGLETAISFAGTGPPRVSWSRNVSNSQVKSRSSFGTPALLSTHAHTSPSLVRKPGDNLTSQEPSLPGKKPPLSSGISGFQALTDSEEDDDEMEEVGVSAIVMTNEIGDKREDRQETQPPHESDSDEDDMEEVEVSVPQFEPATEEPLLATNPSFTPTFTTEAQPALEAEASPSEVITTANTLPDLSSPSTSKSTRAPLFTWSRSPSPAGEGSGVMGIGDGSVITHSTTPQEPDYQEEQDRVEENNLADEEHWDAAHEMDPHAEEGEFAKFLSQVKGRDLDDVRKEIDDEIKVLNEQRKAAMRDSEDITQQMISQIMMMLRLFGIPYITAPMEAEAQCAELVSLGLVDGVITDDSDVFLFGAHRVYKNMFNQSKTVELFLLSDLERELGLDRDTLVRLAYLLGSDYTEGLGGVGPVVAMELLKEFPGKEGLHRFADWWRKVQEGKDKTEESNSKFRRQFKKKFKDLYLPMDWPNPAVRDAYYHPTVDGSEEPFKWGLPDLDALRTLFSEELKWGQAKVDELLLPIIRKMNRRQNNATGTAAGVQESLSDWVSVTAGNTMGGNLAPRKKQVYSSRRLQQVVADFRKRRKSGSVAPSRSASESGDESGGEAGAGGEGEEHPSEPLRKRQRKVKQPNGRGIRGGRGRGRGRESNRASHGKRRANNDDDDYTESINDGMGGADDHVPPSAEVRPRPKPRPLRKGQMHASGSGLEGNHSGQAN